MNHIHNTNAESQSRFKDPRRLIALGAGIFATLGTIFTSCLLLLAMVDEPAPQQRFFKIQTATTKQERPTPAHPKTTPAAQPTERQTVSVPLPQLSLPTLSAVDLQGPALTGSQASKPSWQALPPAIPKLTAVPASPLAQVESRPAQRQLTPDLGSHYPRRARRQGIEGLSRVLLQIDTQGRVQSVTIVSSEPAGVFDAAARRVAEQLRYRPARRDGKAIASQLTETFRWTMR